MSDVESILTIIKVESSLRGRSPRVSEDGSRTAATTVRLGRKTSDATRDLPSPVIAELRQRLFHTWRSRSFSNTCVTLRDRATFLRHMRHSGRERYEFRMYCKQNLLRKDKRTRAAHYSGTNAFRPRRIASR